MIRALWLHGLLCLGISLFPQMAAADAASTVELKPDVRLLIDISGSMKDSDPSNLRAPAVELIVQMLPEGARAGIWIFGEDVSPLVDHGEVDKAWRDEAERAIKAIDNSGQLTNIPAALEAASFDFDRLDPGYRTSIVLLTDGKVDISSSPMANANAVRTLLTKVGPNMGSIGVPVHTIALSDEADWQFLESLAEKTKGIAEKAETAGELAPLFLQSLEMVAPTARVPVAGSSFSIDESVQEFTALVFFNDESSRVGLLSPAGVRYRPGVDRDGAEWFSNKQFALVTITAPEPGEWQLESPEGAMTRVTVISDLKLEVDPLPNSLPTGRSAELGLLLRERGKAITDPEVLGLFQITVEIIDPAGDSEVIDVSANYAVPSDGEFRVLMPGFEAPGRYQVFARVDTRTLQRELPMYVEVTQPLATTPLVTRGEEVPEQNLERPLIALAAIVLVGGVLVWWWLRRRRRRRLEQWQRRASQTTPETAVLAGVSAGEDDA